MKLCDDLGERSHIRLLVHQVVSVLYYLGCECEIGVSKVFHCRSVLRYCLCKVGECLLYSYQVVGSIAALAHYLLALTEICLGFYEVGMKGRPGLLFDCFPRLTIFWILAGIGD